MRHLEQPVAVAGIERHARRRSLDGEPMASEDEQVEIELARSPPATISAAERSLDRLERHEERQRPGRRVRPGGHVERDDRVPEGRLIDDADRRRLVQARDAAQARSRQGMQRVHARCQRGHGVADVGSQADIGSDGLCQLAGPPRESSMPVAMLAPMHDVAVRILHPPPSPRAGELERLLVDVRRDNAERQAAGFARAGAVDVRIEGDAEEVPFGARLRAIVAEIGDRGLVLLGSGAVPLARPADRRAFVSAAAADGSTVLANNRFSADIVAIPRPWDLDAIPDLATDNGLPRWLEEGAGRPVADFRRRWRLAVDLDSPLDAALIGRHVGPASTALARLDAVAAVAGDATAELVVAGRTSAATVSWLEGAVRARVRGLVEERGLRTRRSGQRPARSVLGLLLDRTGPDGLGDLLAELGDAALVDTRVLLAHRCGADEQAWPASEDRFASDLLLADRISDPWLRALTVSAVAAPIPVILGGHSLVGPGVRLALRPQA